ncbi:MAG: hypothetical protein A3G24_01315 [Betaproteobacteria bacterium RIFCSPLOWO2_12_FULL_62_13]|nr:MAG: hypothetical protein A3G24_01315 [Betaproteobacteria bacterium RIFCSPLOWO2_12_FULL_62_13]
MIEICDPRSGPSAVTQGTVGVASLSGKVVGFIDNTKPNFNHLVDDLAEILVAHYGVKKVLKRGKRVQSIPAPEAVYAELKEECDVVITGSGD